MAWQRRRSGECNKYHSVRSRQSVWSRDLSLTDVSASPSHFIEGMRYDSLYGGRVADSREECEMVIKNGEWCT